MVPPRVPRSSVARVGGRLAAVGEAWAAAPTAAAPPATRWPIVLAIGTAPGRPRGVRWAVVAAGEGVVAAVGTSSVAGLRGLLAAVRKACSTPLPVVAPPTTWPLALMPVATLVVPPRVPRSVMV